MLWFIIWQTLLRYCILFSGHLFFIIFSTLTFLVFLGFLFLSWMQITWLCYCQRHSSLMKTLCLVHSQFLIRIKWLIILKSRCRLMRYVISVDMMFMLFLGIFLQIQFLLIIFCFSGFSFKFRRWRRQYQWSFCLRPFSIHSKDACIPSPASCYQHWATYGIGTHFVFCICAYCKLQAVVLWICIMLRLSNVWII